MSDNLGLDTAVFGFMDDDLVDKPSDRIDDAFVGDMVVGRQIRADLVQESSELLHRGGVQHNYLCIRGYFPPRLCFGQLRAERQDIAVEEIVIDPPGDKRFAETVYLFLHPRHCTFRPGPRLSGVAAVFLRRVDVGLHPFGAAHPVEQAVDNRLLDEIEAVGSGVVAASRLFVVLDLIRMASPRRSCIGMPPPHRGHPPKEPGGTHGFAKGVTPE